MMSEGIKLDGPGNKFRVFGSRLVDEKGRTWDTFYRSPAKHEERAKCDGIWVVPRMVRVSEYEKNLVPCGRMIRRGYESGELHLCPDHLLAASFTPADLIAKLNDENLLTVEDCGSDDYDQPILHHRPGDSSRHLYIRRDDYTHKEWAEITEVLLDRFPE